MAPTEEWMEAMPTATVVDLVHKLLCGLFDLGICICAVYNVVHFYLDLCERKLLRFLILCWVLLADPVPPANTEVIVIGFSGY